MLSPKTKTTKKGKQKRKKVASMRGTVNCAFYHQEGLQQNRTLNYFLETAVVHEIISYGVLHRSIPCGNANLAQR